MKISSNVKQGKQGTRSAISHQHDSDTEVQSVLQQTLPMTKDCQLTLLDSYSVKVV